MAEIEITSQLFLDIAQLRAELEAAEAAVATWVTRLEGVTVNIPVRGVDELTARVRSIIQDIERQYELNIPVRIGNITSPNVPQAGNATGLPGVPPVITSITSLPIGETENTAPVSAPVTPEPLPAPIPPKTQAPAPLAETSLAPILPVERDTSDSSAQPIIVQVPAPASPPVVTAYHASPVKLDHFDASTPTTGDQANELKFGPGTYFGTDKAIAEAHARDMGGEAYMHQASVPPSKFYDIDKPLPAEDFQRINAAARDLGHQPIPTDLGTAHANYQQLASVNDYSKTTANKVLQGAGFNGIRSDSQQEYSLFDASRAKIESVTPVGVARPEATIEQNHLGFHHGQNDYQAVARDASGSAIGTADYALYDGKLHVANVDVVQEHRRKGLATRMYEDMLREHPDATLSGSSTTPDGTEFRREFNRLHTDRLTPPPPANAVGYSEEEWEKAHAIIKGYDDPQHPNHWIAGEAMDRMNDHDRDVEKWNSGDRSEPQPVRPDATIFGLPSPTSVPIAAKIESTPLPASTPVEPLAAELAKVDESQLVRAADVRAYEAAPYVKDGIVTTSSRTTPVEGEYPWKEGQWRVDDHFGTRGRSVERLTKIDPNQLDIPEGDHTRENLEGRGADARRYADWIQQGKTPPAIDVVETDSGKLRVSDGHRRVAAAKIAGEPVMAWVSPRMDTGKLDSSGNPIYTGMTYEGAKYGPAQAEKMYNRQQAEMLERARASNPPPSAPVEPPPSDISSIIPSMFPGTPGDKSGGVTDELFGRAVQHVHELGLVSRGPLDKAIGTRGDHVRLGSLIDTMQAQGIISPPSRDFRQMGEQFAQPPERWLGPEIAPPPPELTPQQRGDFPAGEASALVEHGRPTVAPTSSPLRELPLDNVPEYARDEVNRHYELAKGRNLVDPIADLSLRDRLTAQEVRRKLELPTTGEAGADAIDMVRATRTKLGIPSMDEPAEFERFRESYIASKPSPQPSPETPLAPIPVPTVATEFTPSPESTATPTRAPSVATLGVYGPSYAIPEQPKASEPGETPLPAGTIPPDWGKVVADTAAAKANIQQIATATEGAASSASELAGAVARVTGRETIPSPERPPADPVPLPGATPRRQLPQPSHLWLPTPKGASGSNGRIETQFIDATPQGNGAWSVPPGGMGGYVPPSGGASSGPSSPPPRPPGGGLTDSSGKWDGSSGKRSTFGNGVNLGRYIGPGILMHEAFRGLQEGRQYEIDSVLAGTDPEAAEKADIGLFHKVGRLPIVGAIAELGVDPDGRKEAAIEGQMRDAKNETAFGDRIYRGSEITQAATIHATISTTGGAAKARAEAQESYRQKVQDLQDKQRAESQKNANITQDEMATNKAMHTDGFIVSQLKNSVFTDSDANPNEAYHAKTTGEKIGANIVSFGTAGISNIVGSYLSNDNPAALRAANDAARHAEAARASAANKLTQEQIEAAQTEKNSIEGEINRREKLADFESQQKITAIAVTASESGMELQGKQRQAGDTGYARKLNEETEALKAQAAATIDAAEKTRLLNEAKAHAEAAPTLIEVRRVQEDREETFDRRRSYAGRRTIGESAQEEVVAARGEVRESQRERIVRETREKLDSILDQKDKLGASDPKQVDLSLSYGTEADAGDKRLQAEKIREAYETQINLRDIAQKTADSQLEIEGRYYELAKKRQHDFYENRVEGFRRQGREQEAQETEREEMMARTVTERQNAIEAYRIRNETIQRNFRRQGGPRAPQVDVANIKEIRDKYYNDRGELIDDEGKTVKGNPDKERALLGRYQAEIKDFMQGSRIPSARDHREFDLSGSVEVSKRAAGIAKMMDFEAREAEGKLNGSVNPPVLPGQGANAGDPGQPIADKWNATGDKWDKIADKLINSNSVVIADFA